MAAAPARIPRPRGRGRWHNAAPSGPQRPTTLLSGRALNPISPPARPGTGRVRAGLREVAILFVCVVVAGMTSLLRGQDANWDLQNYHYYNPWAWWNGRIFDRDIAAAQLQTFHNALFDLPFFAMVQMDWSPPVIAFALAVPTGIAAYFLTKLLPLLFGDLPLASQRVAVVCAFAIGVTSAMGVATLGTTMNEWPLVALLMPALWLLVRAMVARPSGVLAPSTLLGAGALVGAAAGGKLTAATFAVGICAALLVRNVFEARGLRRGVVEGFLFGLGVLAGMAITFGPWAYGLWTHFDSPVFPYFNQWIQSPWWINEPVLIRDYGPHSLGEWLLFPFRLLGPGPSFVTEVPYQDARFPLVWTLAILAGAAWLSHRIGRHELPAVGAGASAAWRFMTAFFVVAFLLWTAQHSIYRYIVLLDMLTGALIMTLLQRLLRPAYFAGIAIVVTVAIVATTRPADWYHGKFGERWFEVAAPHVESGSLILITTTEPVGFVLPFLPPDARHVGVENNIISDVVWSKLTTSIKQAAREHKGPVYQLTAPPGSGTGVLRTLGFRRVAAQCQPVRTNLRTKEAMELCRLDRIDVPDGLPAH